MTVFPHGWRLVIGRALSGRNGLRSRPYPQKPVRLSSRIARINAMRVGTWNLAGRWTNRHREFLTDAECDVWLLTEVNDRLELPGYEVHSTAAEMAARRRWAAVASRSGIVPQEDPHPASALGIVDGIAVCSTVLPWRSCGRRPPWVGQSHAEKTGHALSAIFPIVRGRTLVWGGDWNHALSGPEYAGSKGGRALVLDTLAHLALKVPTAELPHRLDPLLSIDHIAVPQDADVAHTRRLVAELDDVRLSDHDAYVVDIRVD